MYLLSPLRVLIAAESLDLCTYLRQALAAAALPVDRVVEAYDGGQALVLLDAEIDVVLCPAGLACPAAPTLYAALRQDPRLCRTPVVLLAEAPGAQREADPYAVTLTAPFDAGQLAGAVLQVLQVHYAPPGGAA